MNDKDLIIDPEAIDFSQFSKAPPEAASVHSAEYWRDDVVDWMHGDASQKGGWLPWSKTRKLFRIRPGEITIFTGENGSGKSAMMNQIMANLIVPENSTVREKCLIASFEMKPVRTLDRAIKMVTGHHNPGIRDIDGAMKFLKGRFYLYDQYGAVQAHRVLELARWAVQEKGITQLVVDSWMKLQVANDDFTAQKEIFNLIHAAAKDLDIHIWMVAHPRKRSGDVEKRGPLTKDDIKGSGDMVDQADNVIAVWRNVVKEGKMRKFSEMAYGERTELMKEPDTLLSVLKQRHAEGEKDQGRFGLYYCASTFEFREEPGIPGMGGISRGIKEARWERFEEPVYDGSKESAQLVHHTTGKRIDGGGRQGLGQDEFEPGAEG